MTTWTCLQETMTPKGDEKSSYSEVSADSSMRRQVAARQAKRSMRRSPSSHSRRARSSRVSRSAEDARGRKGESAKAQPETKESPVELSPHATRPAVPAEPPRGGDEKENCRFCWKPISTSPAARAQHEHGNELCIAWQLYGRMQKEEQNGAGWKRARRNAALLKRQRDQEQYPEGRGTRTAGPSKPEQTERRERSRREGRKQPRAPSPSPVKQTREKRRSPTPSSHSPDRRKHRRQQQVVINMRW